MCIRDRFKSATNNIFIAQIYDNSPIDYHERFPGFARKTDTRIPIADPRKIIIEAQINGDWLDIAAQKLGNNHQILDMQVAQYRRDTTWQVGKDEIFVCANHVAPFDFPKSLAFEINITSKNPIPLRVTSYIDDALFAAQKSDDPRLGIGAKPLKTIIKCHDKDGQYIVQETNESGQKVAIYAIHSIAGHFLQNGDLIIQSKNNSIDFVKFVGFEIANSDESPETLIAKAKANALELKQRGFKQIIQKQSETIGKIWEQGGAYICLLYTSRCV